MMITEADCVEALKSKLQHEDFTLDSFSLKPRTERLGFVTKQLELTVTACVHGHLETHTFFVKHMEGGSPRLEQFLLRHKFYMKEFEILRRMIPDLEDVALKKIAAKCFHGVSNRFMILEHLSEFGFELIRLPEVDERHARVGIETIAHFHALSFIKERQQKVSLGEKYKELLYETIAVVLEDDPETCFVHGADQRLRCLVRECLEDCKDIDGCVQRISRKYTHLAKPSSTFRNIICHGDCWANNFLYKYDESDLPVDAILVDYQMVRFVPPAHDIVFFMCLNIPPELRQTHERQLLFHYYESLKTYLANHSINVQDVLSERELSESFDYYSKEYGPVSLVYFLMPAVPKEYWPKLFGDDEITFETLAKGNVSIILKILHCSLEFKAEMKARLLNVLKFLKD